MGIVLKHTLKNIFKKPFRSFMVTFCVFICTIAGLLSFDMTNSIETMIAQFFSSQIGNADIIVEGNEMDLEFLNDPNLPELTALSLSYAANPFTREWEEEYTYVHQDYLTIFGIDLDIARKIGALPMELSLGDEEIALSKEFADDYGYSVGDSIVLHDINDEEFEYTVAEIFDANGKGIFNGICSIVNPEGYKRFYNDGKDHVSELEIDLADNSKAKEVLEYLKENYPENAYESTIDNPQLTEIIGYISKMFFVLFALCLLMVMFVTVSVSERIVCERMSVVGTLRSIGLSSKLTAAILLLENSLYGLIGSVLGCFVYCQIRLLMFNAMFMMTDAEGGQVALEFGHVQPWLIAAVIIGAMVLECLCPLKEIIKAVKTPIRDIIFANKDTSYVFNKVATIIGIVFAIVGIVCVFIPDNFWISIIALVAFTVSLSLLFPYVLKGVCVLLAKLFEKMNMPVASLAVKECYTKKSTVGSSVLITTAVAVAIVVFTLAGSLGADFEYNIYNADVLAITNQTKKENIYSYIKNVEGFKDMEFFYLSSDYVEFNDEDQNIFSVTPFVEGGNRMFNGIEEYPESVGPNEIALDKGFAKKRNIKVGDTVKVRFRTMYYMPIEKELTVSALCNMYHLDSAGTTLLINDSLYENIFGKKPAYVLVNCDDPVEMDKTIEKYSDQFIAQCYTKEEYDSTLTGNAAAIFGVIYFVIIMGVVLTFIGATSNLLIGFEGRKRECAVLCSTSMSRGKLAGMFFIESFVSTGTALIMAVPVGLVLVNPVMNALAAITLNMDVVTKPAEYTVFAIIMWIVFTATAMFPARALKKMKLSEQLKYE